MKITLESTSEVTLVSAGDKDSPIPARVWQGKTESGIAVFCLITRIAVLRTEDCDEFDAELIGQPAPVCDQRAFPLRMIL